MNWDSRHPMTNLHSRIPIQAKTTLRLGQAAQLVGSLFYAGTMWLMALYIIRFDGIDAYGRFAAAMAVAAPIFMLSNARGRLVVSSESETGLPTSAYVLYRMITSLLSFLVVLFISHVLFGNGIWIVLSVALFKAIEAISDVLYGGLQRAGKPQFVGILQTLKGCLFALLLALCWLTGIGTASVVIAVFAMGLVGFVIYDLRVLRQHLSGDQIFLWENISSGELLLVFQRLRPFMAVAFMASLFAVMPRLFLEQLHDYGTLGMYSALMLFTSASLLATAAMGQPYLHDIGLLWADGETGDIYRILLQILLIPFVIAAGFSVLFWLAGGVIFPAMLNGDLELSTRILVLLVAVIFSGNLALVQWYIMVALKISKEQVWLALISLLASTVLCLLLIPTKGIEGAFLADACGLILEASVGGWLILRAISQRSPAIQEV